MSFDPYSGSTPEEKLTCSRRKIQIDDEAIEDVLLESFARDPRAHSGSLFENDPPEMLASINNDESTHPNGWFPPQARVSNWQEKYFPLDEFRKYQEKTIQAILDGWKSGKKYAILEGPTGCHERGTKVLMYDGSCKKVEDISVGDLLMGPDSFPRKVVRLHRGRQEMAKVIPIKGVPFTVNLDHILALQRTPNKQVFFGKRKDFKGHTPYVYITVRDWLASSSVFKHTHKLYRRAINFKKTQDGLLIPPYILGLWLNKDVLRVGFKVELLPEDDYFGFELDYGDGMDEFGYDYEDKSLYLLSDFTVCHNSGKSIIGVTLGLIFEYAWAATPQKMLQDQYIRDFDEFLVELKGRSNYPCLRINFDPWEDFYEGQKKIYGKGTIRYPREDQDYISEKTWETLDVENILRQYHCANAPCCTKSAAIGKKIRAECKNAGICAYIRQRDYAMSSPFTLMNFSNLLLFTKFMPEPYPKRPLLIVDEAHILEHYLYEFATVNLSNKNMQPIADHMGRDDYLRLFKPYDSIAELVDFLKDTLLPAFDRYKRAYKLSSPTDEEEEQHTGDEYSGSLENEYEKMKALGAKIHVLVNSDPTDHSHVVVPEITYDAEKKVCTGIKIKPFSVAHLTNLAFGSSNSKVLLMSATILDATTYCKSIGIDTKDAFFLQVPSTFPAKNRPVICDLTIGSMGYSKIDKTLPKMMEKILELTEKHSSQKGIIHTGNYAIMRKLREFIKKNDKNLYERMLFQTLGTFAEKNQIIQTHTLSPEPTIICGPGFIEGIDLKDALARFNILMKLPYMSLADPLVKRKAEEFPDWYALQTALAIIQAIGRTVRSDTDWAVTYILDFLFQWFYKTNIKFFPEHIRDSISWLTEYGIKKEKM